MLNNRRINFLSRRELNALALNAQFCEMQRLFFRLPGAYRFPRIVIFSIAFVFLVFIGLSQRASAGAGDGSGNESTDELTAGVWREGKAVFSDIKLLDFFLDHARGYRPEQPIPFSHKIHIEKAKLECQYCHSGVAKSPFATIPSVELCMGCHNFVRTETPAIQLLKKHFDEKRPVEWEPVNHLPEHAVFNHERHIKGGIGCQSCHGQVQKMDVVEKVSSLKMGFCVSCHRDKGASIDCGVCHH